MTTRPVEAADGGVDDDKAGTVHPILAAGLLRARERSGLTQDDVAAALGTSRQLVGYWEQGNRTPKTTQVLLLSKLYNIAVEDLVTNVERGEPQAAQMLFRRSGMELAPAAENGIEQFVRFLDFYGTVANKLGQPIDGMRTSPFLPKAGYAEYAVDARRKAAEVRGHLRLGQGPIVDIDAICALLGITVYRAHLGEDLDKTISGAFYRHPIVGFAILINADVTQGRRRFTAAHELAHALLHSGDESIVVSSSKHSQQPAERFADAFAGEFLMPEEGIRRALEALSFGPKVDTVEPVIHLQRQFNVSYVTALVRLNQTGIVNHASLTKLRNARPMIMAARLGYQIADTEMPLDGDQFHDIRFPLKFCRMIRELHDRGGIGEGTIKHQLGLTDEQTATLLQRGESTDDDTETAREWNEYAALGALA